MLKNSLLLVISALMLSAYAAAQNSVAEIDRYVRSVKKVTNSSRKVVVADTADYDQKKSKWTRFASDKALDGYRKKNETYSIAYNWKNGGKVVATNFTDFSPSGDWTQYTFHYFRPDGTVAKVEAELRTFYGDWIVKRNYYFDTSGRQIKKTSSYFNLNTNKPKRPTDDVTSDTSGPFKVTVYKNVRKLPFASLLAAK
jgi:hypothetical protein